MLAETSRNIWAWECAAPSVQRNRELQLAVVLEQPKAIDLVAPTPSNHSAERAKWQPTWQ